MEQPCWGYYQPDHVAADARKGEERGAEPLDGISAASKKVSRDTALGHKFGTEGWGVAPAGAVGRAVTQSVKFHASATRPFAAICTENAEERPRKAPKDNYSTSCSDRLESWA